MTSKGGEAESGATGVELSLGDIILGRFTEGELERDGGWWGVVDTGGGVLDIVCLS